MKKKLKAKRETKKWLAIKTKKNYPPVPYWFKTSPRPAILTDVVVFSVPPGIYWDSI